MLLPRSNKVGRDLKNTGSISSSVCIHKDSFLVELFAVKQFVALLVTCSR
jgi:hypothetical protein